MSDHSNMTAGEVIHEARIAAGCKPGESLIERCAMLRENYERSESPTVTCQMPSFFESQKEHDARLKREFASYEEIGRRWAEKYESHILDIITKALPVGHLQEVPSGVTYFRAGEQIDAGQWACLRDDGMAYVADDQEGLTEAALRTHMTEPIRLAHPDRIKSFRSGGLEVTPGVHGKPVRGTTKEPESRTGRIVYEAVISCEKLPLEKFEGKPIYSAPGSNLVVGRCRNVRHTQAGTVVEIESVLPGVLETIEHVQFPRPCGPPRDGFEFYPVRAIITDDLVGNPPPTDGVFEAKTIEPYNPPVFDEPKQESWRDRPSLLG